MSEDAALGATLTLPSRHDVLAPDGSEVRLLLARPGGSMAHFRLPAGAASRAIRHRTVEEIWYIVSGAGEMWRSDGVTAAVTSLAPGVSLTIPAGIRFQFRTTGDQPLDAIAVTMPPWPGAEEAEFVAGPWHPTAT